MPTPTTPGPSPWYLREPWLPVSTPAGGWRWQCADRGPSRLLAPGGEATVLLLDAYVYALALPGARLLLWYQAKPRRQPTPRAGRIVFTLLDPALLEPQAEPSALLARLEAQEDGRLAHLGPALQTWELGTDCSPGTHALAVPPALAELPEVLALADLDPPADAPADAAADRLRCAIFAVDFRARRLTVLPQHWYNQGVFDFGYQWIARVQRDAASGRIVGEGMRLPPFMLDASGTGLQQWLERDA